MHRIIKYLVTIITLAIGIFVMLHLIKSKERPQRMPQPPMSVTATVMNPVAAAGTVRLQAMGEVIAAKEVAVSPEVSGRIIKVSPKLFLGAHFAAGEQILAIDPTDYKAEVEQAVAQVAQAKVNLEEQEGLSAAANEELKLLDKRGVNVNQNGKRLASRAAYVESARAQLESAESKLAQAKTRLARTVVKAPFSASVKAKYVDKGQVVSSGTKLLDLVADDEVYVVLSVVLSQLKWLDVPGSKVEIVAQTTGNNERVTGTIIAQLPQLKDKSQLAQLLVSVPQKDKFQKLLIGSVVNCTLIGKTIPGVVAIPRQALRDNSMIWVINSEGRLAERPATVLFSDHNNYFLQNDLDLNERIITSRIAVPIPGMPVNVESGAGHD